MVGAAVLNHGVHGALIAEPNGYFQLLLARHLRMECWGHQTRANLARKCTQAPINVGSTLLQKLPDR